MHLQQLLAENNYDIPCVMELYDCSGQACWIMYVEHTDDGSPLCHTPELPLCDTHKLAAQWAASGGVLAALVGVEEPPPCGLCGRPTHISRWTTLRGVEVE